LGLVNAALPFAVLPIFSMLLSVRASLEEAAATLGAGRLTVFWRVVFPLSLPGVAASAVLVFLYSLGAFLSPSLLGGGFVDLIAGFAYEQAMLLSNTGFATAGAMVTLVVAFALVLAVIGILRRLTREG
jgi:ABC-type spermidine/putrescine transport system permease subunit I